MSALRSLLWKEYRDYRWPALLSTVAWAVADLIIRQNSAVADGERMIIFLASILLAIFIATQVIVGERSAGTEVISRTLPLSPLLLSAVKVAAGLLVLLMPVAAVIAVQASVKSAQGGAASWRLEFAYVLVTSTIGVYAWTLFLAGRAASRGSVIMHGLITLCASAIVATFVVRLTWVWLTDGGKDLLRLLTALTPALIGDWRWDRVTSFWWEPRSVVLPVLMAIATFRIAGRSLLISRDRREPIGRLVALRPPVIQSAAVSLAWKAFRETRTLALAIFLFNIFFAGLIAAAESFPISSDARFTAVALAQLPALVNGFWNISGAALAIALGLQMTHGKLRPQAVAFWHSRPLNPISYLLTHMLMAFTLLVVGTFLFRSIIDITPQGYGRIADGGVYMMSRVALSLQLIVLPATMLIATFVRSALATVSLATALLFTLFITGAVLWQWKDVSAPPPLQSAPIVSLAVLISALLSAAVVAAWVRRFPASFANRHSAPLGIAA